MKRLGRPDWSAIRLRLYHRAYGCCEYCGSWLGSGWVVHHRRAKGMGGSRRPDTHSAANLLALHNPCHHNMIHAYPERARQEGTILSASQTPADVPVFVAYGADAVADGGLKARVLLTDDYDYEPVAAAVAE